MWFKNLYKSLTSTSPRKRPNGRRPPALRLRLEPLEDRRLLAFIAPVDYGAELSAEAVVSADFNGDGRVDLAALDSPNSTVSVFLGNGDGAFQAAQTSDTANGPKTLAAGDLNGDDRADLVTVHDSHLGVLLANGDGTFAPPQTITLPAQVPPDDPAQGTLEQGLVSVAIGDFNGDGELDLVAGGQTTWFTIDNEGYITEWHVNNYANVLLGNGDGTFAPAAVKHLAGVYPHLYPGDFNNDGRLDIVLSGGSALGNGDGTLQDVVPSSVYVSGESQSVADLNGDGNLDLLSNLSWTGGPRLHLGNGDGTFQQGQNLDSNSYQWGTVAGDVNADGKLDVVSLRSDYTAGTRSARVLLGNGNGSFSQPIIVDFGTVAGQADFMSPVLADFDGNGFPDLAMIERFTSEEGAVAFNGVHVALNDGNWTPPPPPPPSITMSDVTVTEGNTGTRAATFTVTLSAAYSQPVTVAYATANGTATAGSDYQSGSGTLTFAPGQTSKTITVSVIGDRLAEPNETYFVNLSSPANAVIGDGQGVGTIVDDEPRISIGDVTKAEGKKGQTTLFTFTVTLSVAYDQAVSMSFATANGTAKTSDGDYVARTGTLTFAPGETTKTITIEVKGDSKREANEYFYLDLFGNSGNSLFTKNRGLGTILNDD